MDEKYRIITSRPNYKGGYRQGSIEELFPKIFNTKDEAESFGNKFFNPPLSIEKWAVEEVKSNE